jgi:hypothetical protein
LWNESVIKMTVFWDVAPFNMIDVYSCFIGAYCLYPPDDGGTKRLQNVGKLQLDYTAQHPRRQSLLLAAVRTWNLTWIYYVFFIDTHFFLWCLKWRTVVEKEVSESGLNSFPPIIICSGPFPLDSTLLAALTITSLTSCPNFHCKTYITAPLPFTIHT